MTLRSALRLPWSRRLACPEPHFLIIGAARSGTTSLFHYLAGHPQVAVPATKEIHFFDLQYDKGLEWYRHVLRERNRRSLRRRIVGEATPSYMFLPQAISRIRQHFPAVKLIALLRDPVERAYSHYWHMVRLGYEPLAFEDAVQQEPERLNDDFERAKADERYTSEALVRHSYLLRGVYADQLDRVFRHFPRDQVKILKSEDLYADPQKSFDGVVDFLGLRRCAIAGPRNMSTITEGTGTWRPPPMPAGLRDRLREYFRPHNHRLYALLDRDFGW